MNDEQDLSRHDSEEEQLGSSVVHIKFPRPTRKPKNDTRSIKNRSKTQEREQFRSAREFESASAPETGRLELPNPDASSKIWYGGRLRTPKPYQCEAGDCHRPVFSKNYCPLHSSRARKYGDPNCLRYRADGQGHIDKSGYKRITTKSGYKQEHRTVMEAYLGRPLATWERIRHINGNRLDNRIENLELMPRKSSRFCTCIGETALCKHCQVSHRLESNRNRSKAMERDVAKTYQEAGFAKARRVPASGAIRGLPGDVEVEDFLLAECKLSSTGRLSINPKWISKIQNEAKQAGKRHWALHAWVRDGDDRYQKVVLIDPALFFELTGKLVNDESTN